MVDINKRRFFGNLIREIVHQTRTAMDAGMREAKQCEDYEEFFESYESCYALTLAYPDEILLESARNAGIETEGREKIDIVRELFNKKGGD